MSADRIVVGESNESSLFCPEHRKEVTRAAGNGGEDLLLKEYTVSVGIDEKFLEMSSNDGCTTANIILCWCIEYVNMVNTAHFICMLQLKK